MKRTRSGLVRTVLVVCWDHCLRLKYGEAAIIACVQKLTWDSIVLNANKISLHFIVIILDAYRLLHRSLCTLSSNPPHFNAGSIGLGKSNQSAIAETEVPF